METFLTLGIALGLMAVVVFGLMLIGFLMLFATVFSLMMHSAMTPGRRDALTQRAANSPLALVPRTTSRRGDREIAA